MSALIRIRATPNLLDSIQLSPGDGEGGIVDLPPRPYPWSVGDDVRLEFGFGAFEDEVVCDGVIVATVPAEDAVRVRVRVDAEHRKRLEFVSEVLSRSKSPVQRRYPRAPYRAAVDLKLGGRAMHAYTEDISCGGAFIVSEDSPAVGAEVEVRIDDDPVIRTKAKVTWVGVARRKPGFGVEFALTRTAHEQVREIVRQHSN